MSEEKNKTKDEIEDINEAEDAVAIEAEDVKDPGNLGADDESGADDETADKEDGAEAETEVETEAETSDEDGAEDKAGAAESERYMRLMAEFQNYKKRVAKEKSDIHAYANENIMSGLLEVLDNFERALDADPGADAEGYAKGMELILTKMQDVLGKAGLEEIKALGEDFDPAFHNAVMTEETEEFESGKVSRVMQKGYMLNGKVIRPAMVAVSQ